MLWLESILNSYNEHTVVRLDSDVSICIFPNIQSRVRLMRLVGRWVNVPMFINRCDLL